MLLLLLLGWHCWTGRSIYDRWDHVDLAQKHHSNSNSSSTQFQVPEWAQAGVTSPVAFDDVSFWSRNPPLPALLALPAPSWAAVVAVPIHFGWPFGFTPRCVRQRTANSHAKWHLCHALHIPRHMIWLGTGRDRRTDRQTDVETLCAYATWEYVCRLWHKDGSVHYCWFVFYLLTVYLAYQLLWALFDECCLLFCTNPTVCR